MPMSFPDLPSLVSRAGVRGFRQPKEGETVSDYRAAFALFMRDIDLVESMEISSGSGWDQWSLEESEKLMREVKPEIGDLIDELAQRYPNTRITIEPAKPLEFFGGTAEAVLTAVLDIIEDIDILNGIELKEIDLPEGKIEVTVIFSSYITKKYSRLLLDQSYASNDLLTREIALMFSQAVIYDTDLTLTSVSYQ